MLHAILNQSNRSSVLAYCLGRIFNFFFSSLSISILSYDYQIQLISLSNIGCDIIFRLYFVVGVCV